MPDFPIILTTTLHIHPQPFIGAYLMLRQRIRFALVPSADEIRNKFPGMLTGEGGFPWQIS